MALDDNGKPRRVQTVLNIKYGKKFNDYLDHTGEKEAAIVRQAVREYLDKPKVDNRF